MKHTSESKQSEQGVTLYITIVILSLLVGSVLSLTGVLTGQMKVIFRLGDAVTAFSAADAGIEQALYNIRRLEIPGGTGFPKVFSNGAIANVTISVGPAETVIKSTGTYKETKRAIEIRY
ncbi:MAG: hypothetical protein HQ539_02425 [Parcubacteria group bacterium]|nr:hypothetical protein [Parcubacteria group bacterium]